MTLATRLAGAKSGAGSLPANGPRFRQPEHIAPLAAEGLRPAPAMTMVIAEATKPPLKAVAPVQIRSRLHVREHADGVLSLFAAGAGGPDG